MSGTLDATLTVAPSEEALTLTLTVENVGPTPVELTFPDGQRAEFVAVDQDGNEVWRWSEDRLFTMALGSKTLAPGESVDYEGEWTDPPHGEYEITGMVTATDADAETSMTVVR